ncbi:hypothetical protein AP1H75_12010 [Apilactobacillus apinorum]|uniref:hypothetical protein n=1 Tax=Apilactobacillus apinorum TaxID=1218495 RepID=UPI0030E95878
MKKRIMVAALSALIILQVIVLTNVTASAAKVHSGLPRFARGYWASKNLVKYHKYRNFKLSKDTFAIDGIDMEGVNYSYLKRNDTHAGYSLGTIMYSSFKKIGNNKYHIYAKKQSPLNYADAAEITAVGKHKIKVKLFKKGHRNFGGSNYTLYKINKHSYSQLAKKD